MDLPISGNFFGPNTMRASTKMTMSSVGPMLNILPPG